MIRKIFRSDPMTREHYLHRLHEFPHEIRTLAETNTIIHRVIEEYAHGAIITREEALCRMIIILARSQQKFESYPPLPTAEHVKKWEEESRKVKEWEKEVRNNPPKKVV